MPPLALNVRVEPVGVAGRELSRSLALPPKSAMPALCAVQTSGMDELGVGCVRTGILRHGTYEQQWLQIGNPYPDRWAGSMQNQ